MTSFPGSPRLLKGGIVVIDPVTGNLGIITLQYNPETLSRTLQVKGVGGEGGDRMDALRLTGPPVETIKLEAEIDATDQLELSDQHLKVISGITAGRVRRPSAATDRTPNSALPVPSAGGAMARTDLGIHPQLAALETLVYPPSGQIQSNDTLARFGTLEIVPMEAPLTLFVWSNQRVVPVRLTDFSITEEAFDPLLNPIRAKVSLGLRVLSVNDLPPGHRGYSIFMAYLQKKERLAGKSAAGDVAAFGITGIP